MSKMSRKIQPEPMQRSKDELMLLEMQNIYNKTGGKPIKGGDIAEVTSISSDRTDGFKF